MSKKWKGPGPVRSNVKFEDGSPEHEAYKARQRGYYNRNAESQRERANKNVALKRERNQQWMVNYMVGKACAGCGESDPRKLSFNHLPGFEKHANIADLVSKGARLALIEAETAKCEILCHNCHMLVTLKNLGGSYHDRLTPTSVEDFNAKYGATR